MEAVSKLEIFSLKMIGLITMSSFCEQCVDRYMPNCALPRNYELTIRWLQRPQPQLLFYE
jgi:hypothetical protein